jgi:hypothetical protein
MAIIFITTRLQRDTPQYGGDGAARPRLFPPAQADAKQLAAAGPRSVAARVIIIPAGRKLQHRVVSTKVPA